MFLDFGEIFPFLSADGQRDVVKQVLELCPTNKIMWSSEHLSSHTEGIVGVDLMRYRALADGHFWPESYYLGTLQARQALYQVRPALSRVHRLSSFVLSLGS